MSANEQEERFYQVEINPSSREFFSPLVVFEFMPYCFSVGPFVRRGFSPKSLLERPFRLPTWVVRSTQPLLAIFSGKRWISKALVA